MKQNLGNNREYKYDGVERLIRELLWMQWPDFYSDKILKLAPDWGQIDYINILKKNDGT